MPEIDEEAEAQARAERAAHNPHAPPPHEDSLLQKARNEMGVADTIENRLLRLEREVFGEPIIEAGPLKAETADETDQPF